MIKEEDCNVRMPNPVDDKYLVDNMNWLEPSPEMATFALTHTIVVIGGIARLLRMLKAPQIPRQALQAYDRHFDEVIGSFPTSHQPHAYVYIDPIEMPPIIYLQNARLILHRHNLTPTCEQATRTQAVDSCASVAKDTARFMRRCMQPPPAGRSSSITTREESWESRLIAASSAFICTHLWRCTLLLLFRFDFESALACARASAVLGDTRRVNTACGRFLDFFLSQCLAKLKQRVDFDTDEEMIAYASGDLQGSFESSWIWQESKGNIHLGTPLQDTSRSHSGQLQAQLNEVTDTRKENDWAGWDKIVKLIEGLADEQKQASERFPPTTIEVMQPRAIHLPPLIGSPSPSTTPSRDRLSIKDLL